MMTLEQVKEKLQDRNIAEVSRRCNLQYQTVFNIATGRNKNPSYNTVVKLVEYFKGDWNEQVWLEQYIKAGKVYNHWFGWHGVPFKKEAEIWPIQEI